MNYIKHLTAFFETIATDYRLNPSHVSLYMALFQFWNLNRFENPISISRYQVLQLSKIGSNHTYHKCLNDLHNYGYIHYNPSHNPLKGSEVYLFLFDTSSEQVLHNFSGKFDTSTAQALHSSLNNINSINNKTCGKKNSHANINNPNEMILKNEPDIQEPNSKRKKVALKKEKTTIPPSIDEVLSFFKQENYPEIEAQKFFNHFQSNGWKVGGKSPMKDWIAAARNWILNIRQFSSNSKPYSSTLNTKKNYGEPL